MEAGWGCVDVFISPCVVVFGHLSRCLSKVDLIPAVPPPPSSLSAYTTALLGVDGTYFGIELGFVQASKHYVQRFPYGVIPHPMILSQCVALLGLFRHAAFRAAWPYLVPAHICFYMTHMVQEHFDIHKARTPKQSRVEKVA
jgi:hypothetical protein